jgi:hypothetical protein
MKELVKYFMGSLYGSVLGLLVYFAAIFINQYNFIIIYAIFSLLIGIIIGIFLVKFLKVKHYKIYSNDKFLPWMLLFIEINLFSGLIGGLILWFVGSWLLILLFSLLFGHPENGWSTFIANSFKLLSLIIGIFSVSILTNYLLKSSILKIEKKIQN